MYKLGQRSLQNLSGVHPELVAVVKRAIEITEQDFSVLEGVRSLQKQEENVAKGVSKTMNSRHLTGHAVDLTPYPLPKGEWQRVWWNEIADAMHKAADDLGVPLESGHKDWGWDSPHFQLPWGEYPK